MLFLVVFSLRWVVFWLLCCFLLLSYRSVSHGPYLHVSLESRDPVRYRASEGSSCPLEYQSIRQSVLIRFVYAQSQENQKRYFKAEKMTAATRLILPFQKSFSLISRLCLFMSLAALTSLLTTSGLAWAHPVTFLRVDDVVRPEEGVIDLDWHKQPVPCLACHTASLGHCSMPECQMRRDGEHTGWWPADDDVGYSCGEAGTHLEKKKGTGITVEHN